MSISPKRSIVLAVLLLATVVAVRWSLAQSGSRSGGSRSAPPRTYGGSDARGGSGAGSGSNAQPQSNGRAPAAADPFPAKLWEHLTTARVKYDYWAPFPGRSEELTPGQSPHGKFVRVYANKAARDQPDTIPNGSILIKENYGDDGRTLMAITVMYRSAGYNKPGGDWYWVKYRPDGTVDAMPSDRGPMAIAGPVGMCIECHQQADGNDFVFVNDQPVDAQ